MSKKRKKPEADEEQPAPAPAQVVEDSDDGSTEQATDDFLGEDD